MSTYVIHVRYTSHNYSKTSGIQSKESTNKHFFKKQKIKNEISVQGREGTVCSMQYVVCTVVRTFK